MLANNASKNSIFVDARTSSNQLPFLGITCHCIDSQLEIERQILHFQDIEGEHSGERLGIALYECFKDFKLPEKMLNITTDNAKNNDTMMRELEQLPRSDILPIQTEWAHVRCIAHVIHFAAGQLLRPFKPPQVHFHMISISETTNSMEDCEAIPLKNLFALFVKFEKVPNKLKSSKHVLLPI